MLEGSFFSLDATTSTQRPSACALLGSQEQRLSSGYLGSDAQILDYLRQTSPSLVAIDAPLSLPRGLCCLEETCPCQAPGRVRSCEREMARLSIGCYFTTKRSIIKEVSYQWIRRKHSEVAVLFVFTNSLQYYRRDLY